MFKKSTDNVQAGTSIPSLPGNLESSPSHMQFSLMYFSSTQPEHKEDRYRLLLEGARFADSNNFTAIWTPERHFHILGGLYPNPSVLSSALAMITQRIRLRAGSVVLPLHNIIRIVEEWAIVDNLSHGRVDLAFARGWNPDDFVLAPQNFAPFTGNTDALFSGITMVQKLWRGEEISLPNGANKNAPVRIYPQPYQQELPVWVTCTSGAQRFREAGAFGAHVLTALLFQSLEDLEKKIALYRQARAEHGYDPETGHVTLMLHTFVGEDLELVREIVRKPLIEYLRTSIDLWRHGTTRLDNLSAEEQEELLDFGFERYFQTSALLGTPATCLQMVKNLQKIGVNEIACLIDFGVAPDAVLRNLDTLNALKEQVNREQNSHSSAPMDVSLSARLDQLSDEQINALLNRLQRKEGV